MEGGHESAGVNELSTSWFLAEGATGPFFETFVLLANPNDTPADVTLRFLPAAARPSRRPETMPGRSRVTVNIECEDPSLNNVPVATQVTSTQPIVVERAQYWPDPAPQWYEAHNSFGVTQLGTRWGLAEGRVGGPNNYQTYILLANPGTERANVTVQFLRDERPAAGEDVRGAAGVTLQRVGRPRLVGSGTRGRRVRRGHHLHAASGRGTRALLGFERPDLGSRLERDSRAPAVGQGAPVAGIAANQAEIQAIVEVVDELTSQSAVERMSAIR